MTAAIKQTPADFCTSAESGFNPPLGSRCLEVVERLHLTSGGVHPGWVRATSILLRGMERLRSQEAAEGLMTANLPDPSSH